MRAWGAQGLDKVLVYKLDAAAGRLARHSEAAVPVGGAARHLSVHPNGKWVYVNGACPLACTIAHLATSCRSADCRPQTAELLGGLCTALTRVLGSALQRKPVRG